MDKQIEPAERLLSSEQAAHFFGVSNGTMARARRWGTLFGLPAPPFLKFKTGTVRYKLSDLNQWIDTNGECVGHGG